MINGSVVTIGGVDYELMLTTRATKEIAKRYGGLEQLGDKLMKADNFEQSLDEVIWLITILANQSILIHNLKNQVKKELLTTDAVELLTAPSDLVDYKNAITEAIMNGTKRTIESVETTKNTIAE